MAQKGSSPVQRLLPTKSPRYPLPRRIRLLVLIPISLLPSHRVSLKVRVFAVELGMPRVIAGSAVVGLLVLGPEVVGGGVVGGHLHVALSAGNRSVCVFQ